MYVIYVSMHDVHVICDAFNDFYDEYDVCMMMFSMLNMPYDVVCHIASCRYIDIGHNPKCNDPKFST